MSHSPITENMRRVLREIEAGRGADYEVTNQQARSRTLTALCKRRLLCTSRDGRYYLTADGRESLGLPREEPSLREVMRVIADFLGSPKDRFGRVDLSNDQAREARERIRQLALHYKLGGSETYLDQCAAVLRAAAS